MGLFKKYLTGLQYQNLHAQAQAYSDRNDDLSASAEQSLQRLICITEEHTPRDCWEDTVGFVKIGNQLHEVTMKINHEETSWHGQCMCRTCGNTVYLLDDSKSNISPNCKICGAHALDIPSTSNLRATQRKIIDTKARQEEFSRTRARCPLCNERLGQNTDGVVKCSSLTHTYRIAVEPSQKANGVLILDESVPGHSRGERFCIEQGKHIPKMPSCLTINW